MGQLADLSKTLELLCLLPLHMGQNQNADDTAYFFVDKPPSIGLLPAPWPLPSSPCVFAIAQPHWCFIQSHVKYRPIIMGACSRGREGGSVAGYITC